MIKINSPRGLGDAIHVRAIVLHLFSLGENVTVFTRWPDVFADLDGLIILPVEEAGAHRETFSARTCFQCLVPSVRELSQFRGACLQVGIYDPIDLDIRWRARNAALLQKTLQEAGGRPVLLFQPLKRAGNADEEERRPDRGAFRRLVANHPGHFKIKVGHPDFAEDDAGLAADLDLFGRTSISEAIDLATIADVICAEPSFLGILAQAFDKRFTCIFSARALRSGVKKVAGVTPTRIFHRPDLCTAVYDEDLNAAG